MSGRVGSGLVGIKFQSMFFIFPATGVMWGSVMHRPSRMRQDTMWLVVDRTWGGGRFHLS